MANVNGISNHDKEKILGIIEEHYKEAIWFLRDDFRSESAFKEAINQLNMSSSPGHPYCNERPTIGEWLQYDEFTRECDAFQLSRLWHEVQDVLNGGFEVVLKTFVKQEPHKKTKALEGRWRLIMCSPLNVQVAWQMVFGPSCDVEIERAIKIPSQQGCYNVNGTWKLFYRQWKHLGLSSGVDKSAWDWTAPQWAIDLDLESRYRLCRGAAKFDWMRVAEDLYHRMFHDPVILMTDGTLYKQRVPGVMKSGCVATISLNSKCQVILHSKVCLDRGISVEPMVRACGDDTLQHPKHTDNINAYRKYGVIVKSCSDGYEFVGHEYTDRGPQPLYLNKHLSKLVHVSDEILPQYLDSMARMYVHTEIYWFWDSLATRAGCCLPYSREYYKQWYDYAEA